MVVGLIPCIIIGLFLNKYTYLFLFSFHTSFHSVLQPPISFISHPSSPSLILKTSIFQTFIYSPTHPLIHLSTHPLIHSSIYPTHLFIHPSTHPLIHSSIHPLIHLSHSFIHPSIHPCIPPNHLSTQPPPPHPVTHSFNHSPIHSLIHSSSKHPYP